MQKDSIENFEKLKKGTNSSGRGLMFIGILNFLFSLLFIFVWNDYAINDYDVVIFVMNTIIFVILLVVGNNVRMDSLEDLNKSHKRIFRIIIFLFVICILAILNGAIPGIILIFVLIDLFKTKKLIKTELS